MRVKRFTYVTHKHIKDEISVASDLENVCYCLFRSHDSHKIFSK